MESQDPVFQKLSEVKRWGPQKCPLRCQGLPRGAT